MIDQEIPEEFWKDNVSRNHGKHNILPAAWEIICKIRNSPIRLLKPVIIGEDDKPHIVIPKGYKGYLIDFPEAFSLPDHDLKAIYSNSLMDENLRRIPTWFCGINDVVFLNDEDYEIIAPYFDIGLANYGGSHVVNI
jgi:hypothetical protein